MAAKKAYIKDTRFIPMKVLRAVLPDLSSKKRKDFVDKLDAKNPARLKKLSIHYASNREKSFYLYKCLSSLNFKSSLKKLRAIEKRLTKEDIIYDTKRVTPDKEKSEITLKMRIHSERKKLTAETAEDLKRFSVEYRRPSTIYITFHIEDKVLEIKTRSGGKAVLCSEFLSQKLFSQGQQFGRYYTFKLKQNVDNLIYKKVIFRGLDFAGAKEISISGDDVKQTVDVLKERKIDLQARSSETPLWDKEEAGQQFKFYSDGKIVHKARIENPYYLLKELFTFE